ncbi:enoyl-CoA hydratase/isomerase family protein [Ramlibacter henchirensis]|uniref:Enoyl-CoA hydratase/isomerase family protein n=1 Tax=Ramlibacter henchirensis TaxID=204072 RepID=A0A4Z0BXB4_9BURK|nr:enoyl-CoA hydratase/isomerase family protein [Ramlibacter henchirensis]TFZ02645.1 enoyl-CoA hydratase/isomerase family protein [Ramlibacter henchirensis]
MSEAQPNYIDIAVSRREQWIEIEIRRPEKFNALREQTAAEIMEAMALAEEDDAIVAVLLSGNAKAFCSGIDTVEFQVPEGKYFDFYRKRKRSKRFARLFRDLPQYTKPVICAVEGVALGGGLELALVADIVVAGRDARFGFPETGIGIMPGAGGTQTLPRLIGKALAKELIWTGRRIAAEEALAMRLVNHVVDAGGALDKAREIATAIGRNAPLAVMQSKAVIERGFDLPLADAMAMESDAVFMLYFSEDRREGLQAFREKRPARFRGA